MKKIRTPQEGAGAALSARSTSASNRTPQTQPEGVLSGFSAIAEQFIAASQSAAIPHASGERCPVRALSRWLEVSEINEGFVFRAVSRHDRVARQGLSAQSVALVVKASVARVGGDSKKVSGHSLRAGYCTSAAEKGLQPWQIREQTGHKSDVTLAKYIRPVAKRKIPSLL